MTLCISGTTWRTHEWQAVASEAQKRYNFGMYLDKLPDIHDVQFTFGRRAKEQIAKNYVIYCRKSDERDDRTSIPAQLKQCIELAEREGLNVIGVIKEQKSARVHGRLKFSNLIAAIKGEDELKFLERIV